MSKPNETELDEIQKATQEMLSHQNTKFEEFVSTEQPTLLNTNMLMRMAYNAGFGDGVMYANGRIVHKVDELLAKVKETKEKLQGGTGD